MRSLLNVLIMSNILSLQHTYNCGIMVYGYILKVDFEVLLKVKAKYSIKMLET